MLGFRRAGKPTPPDGAKGNERIALCERCEFEVSGSGAPREGVAWNVSVAGLYLVVPTELPPTGATVQVTLWLPGDPEPIRAEAEVVWCNPPSPFRGCGASALRYPPGCGLRFVRIPDADLGRIQTRVQVAHTLRDPHHQR